MNKRDVGWLSVLVIVIASAAHFSFSAARVDWAKPFNIQGLALGMTRDEVKSQMGSTGESVWVRMCSRGGFLDKDYWSYKSALDSVRVRFSQDRVFLIEGNSLSQGTRRLLSYEATPGLIELILGSGVDQGRSRFIYSYGPHGSFVMRVRLSNTKPVDLEHHIDVSICNMEALEQALQSKSKRR